MRFVHTPNAICATTETGRVSGAILKRPPEWANALWDRLAPQVCELLSAQPRGVTCADLITAGYIPHIKLTKAEVSSGYNRLEWADDLIRQLPEAHEGRNSWLMNYGRRYAPGTASVIPEAARPGESYDDRDAIITELRSALTETQRAVGEAQTEVRDIDLGASDVCHLSAMSPGSSVLCPGANVRIHRV